jgi:hypothetical protein
MYQVAPLSCHMCFFIATSHEQWGNHIIESHSSIFHPLYPPKPPQPQYLHHQPSTSSGIKEEFQPTYIHNEEKENQQQPRFNPQFYVPKEETKSTSPNSNPPRPIYIQKQEEPLQMLQPYNHNPYQIVLNQFIKCPFCQFLGTTPDVLQVHINSEHNYQDKTYTDLKPVNMIYNPDQVQLVNLVNSNQVNFVNRTPPLQVKSPMSNGQIVSQNKSPNNQSHGHLIIQSKSPTILQNLDYQMRSPNNVQNHQQFVINRSPNVIDYGAGSLSITPVQNNPQNLTRHNDEEKHENPQHLVSKINLLTVENDSGAQGAKKKSKKRNPKSALASTSTSTTTTTDVDKKLECNFCEKTFRRRDHLNKHVRGVHTTERNFVCPVCSKKYTSDGTLKQHVSNSHSQKLQQCNYCDKAFARKDHLMKHIQGVHFKERKYICQHCSKGYTSQGAMLQHVGKAHLEKNFECHKCSRKFATNVRLQIHIQETTSAENSFVCQVCEERFSSAASLFEHSGKSHKMKAWKCETCGGGFRGKYILHAHMKKMHNL